MSRAHQSGSDVRRRGPANCVRRERLAPAASAARAEAAQEGQASPARVELEQESRNDEMDEAYVTNSAENVKLRIDESREDSTEAVSRMEDGNTPVGGPLEPAEVNSRSEGFHRRESENQRKEELLGT